MKSKMKYKLVIFDFDGTLADSFPWFTSVLNTAADTYKFKRISAGEVDTLRGYGGRQIIKHLGVPLWKMPSVAMYMRRAMSRDVSRIRVFEGVDSLLRELSERGVILAVVSSNACENVRQVLGPTNAALIRYYECSVPVFAKAARFRKILRQSGVGCGDAICIGDEVRDCEAAKAAKIAFGGVTWGYNSPEAIRAQAPAEVFATLEEILEKLS
jgi:phosphoglycolate phosphatase